MLIDIKVPELAESVSEASLVDWLKQEGAAVEQGENLIDIETDKVVLEVTAPNSGVLKEIKAHNGDEVAGQEVIGIIDTEGVPTGGAETESAPGDSEQASAGTLVEDSPAPKAGTADAAPAQATAQTPDPAQLSPAVRRLLDEHGLQAADIDPTGGRRITKSQVLDYLEQGEQGQDRSADAAESDGPTTTRERPADAPTSMPDERATQRVPMSRLRQRIAERLVSAQQENAILTTFNEVNMQPVMDLRRRYREVFENTHGVRLGVMSFFVLAAVEALKRYPIINASVDGTDIVYHAGFDIGIAVSSPRGLVVPVLASADGLTMAQMEQRIAEFGRKAQANKLTPEDLSGGTFTITNGGVFGSLLSTPILNPPQSAILGMHKIEERVIAERGQPAVRPMMYLALSYDHRIIDGKEAVQFLVAIKELIEDPNRLLLQV